MNREGNCLVPIRHLEDGYRLGQWVFVQRQSKLKLSANKINRLNKLKFIWAPHDYQWENGYFLLKKFNDREGHSKVPQDHVEDDFKLGNWVSNQRSRKVKLSDDKKIKLNLLNFIWDFKNK